VGNEDRDAEQDNGKRNCYLANNQKLNNATYKGKGLLNNIES